MIKKKEGKINEIIYNNTIYNEGNNRFYPTIDQLVRLIDKTIEANETTEYIRIIPFYRNYKINGQMELDDYMFYLECRDNFSKDDLKNHLTECMDTNYDVPHEVKRYDEMSNEEKRYAHTMYPLCQKNDIETYKEILLCYRHFLNELIPSLFKKVREEMDLSLDDLAFGYFCFEVHSM